MFLALLIAALVFIVLAIVLKNWVLGAVAVCCIIGALLFGR